MKRLDGDWAAATGCKRLPETGVAGTSSAKEKLEQALDLPFLLSLLIFTPMKLPYGQSNFKAAYAIVFVGAEAKSVARIQ